MRLLILSATYLECRPCFTWLDEHPALPVDRLISGVGQLAAAVALQKRVLLQRPDLIIQAGIAGAASAADIGEVFAVDSEIIADLGADEPGGFRNLFEMNLAEPDGPPFSGGKLVNPYRKLLNNTGLTLRTGLTVNHISTDKNLLLQRKQNYPLFVESMEGAALHFVALNENIPFLQIRAVSNEAGERDKTRWQLKASLEALNTILQTQIKKLINSNETYSGL